MAQDNTPAIVMYKGAQEDGYSIPFDKGFYGEVKVAFVRRGLTDYEYNPTTFSVDGELYAWEYEEEQGKEKVKKYYYTKSNTDKVFDSNNKQIQGVTLVSIAGAVAKFSDGKECIRTRKKDIFFHSLLDWTGEPLGDDDWICIVRDTVKKQPYSYPNNQKHIEGALDNLSRQIQELKAQSDVSLKVDPTFVQDPQKMNPIDWLNTIVRSTDTSARGLRYRNFWLEYSTDDPNKAESDKSWTKLLNTTNVTTIRQLYNEETNEYYFQYSMDGGASWLSVGLSKADIDKIIDEANAYSDEQNALLESRINGKLTAIDSQIDANADAIQKTREDFTAADQAIRDDMNAEDGRLQSQITAHASAITTNKNDIDELGDQVAEIESKIPESASSTNPLVTKGDLADIDLDGYVKKSGDTMTGDLSFDIVDDKYKNIVWNPESEVWVDDNTVKTRKYLVGPKIVSYGFDILERYPTYNNASVVLGGVSVEADRFYPARSDGVMKLGLPNRRWDNVYTTNINNGNDLIVPSEGGTLARMEDLIDLRADINEADSELQTQITHQAAEIATKQDKLIAGDNIVISGNTISATGAGGGTGFDVQVVQELPATGQKGIIYLLAKDGTAPDVYDEYVWIETTQTFELIGTTQVDLTDYAKKEELDDYLPLSGGTVNGVVKIQNGQGTGSLWVGADVNNTTLTNNQRHLARIVVPSFTNTERGATLLGWDSSGDTNVHIANNSADMVGFGGSKKITNATSPMGISFCVAKTRESTAAADKVYPLAMDANAANFDVPVSAPDLTVGTAEGTINIGVVAGMATIATNNGLDIAAQTKFDTAPTTDDTTAWADVNSTALVTKQQVTTALSGAGGGASLPDQTGNAGKFLQTDGGTLSWAKAWGYSDSLPATSIVVTEPGYTTSASYAVFIGTNMTEGAIGSVGIGYSTQARGAYSVCIGYRSATSLTTGAHGIAIGAGAQVSAKGAIQFNTSGGSFSSSTVTNGDANTFKVANNNGNFEIMSADGTIPAERMSATAGTTGQVLTKTDTGMAWADASGGDGDIDCGVMS